jgi:hypothetical protein
MPPLSTHFRFVTLILPSLGIASHAGSFLFGVTAPDACEPASEERFSQYHFIGSNGQISLESFRKATSFTPTPSDDASWSFTCGYYSHLWLDVF